MNSVSLGGYGEGGCGVVKAVIVPELGGRVARKTLKHSFLREAKIRFFREIELLQKLNHPNIVRVLKAVPDANPPYYFMEFMENGPLSRHIGNLDIEEKFRIALQITAVLAFCHERGICHRDGKPDNVLLDGKMNVKLADFGMGREAGYSLDLTRQPLGTPGYIAPEVLGGQKGDAASDIYSFGIVLNELFTDGNWPDSGVRPSHAIGALSPQVDRLILSMVSSVPARRPMAHECYTVIWSALSEYNRMLRLAGVPELQIEDQMKKGPDVVEVAAWTGGGAALGAIVGSIIDSKKGAEAGAGVGALVGLLVSLFK